MSEPSTSPADGYDVVLLIEQPLSGQDAAQVLGLHREAPAPVRYHVVLPVEEAAARVESAMGALGTGEALVAAPLLTDPAQLERMQHDLLDRARADLARSVAALEDVGATVSGELATVDPVEALCAKVEQLGAAEVIVLTRPHVVAEFFRLDWTSRARRKLGVPVLHLLEHETFDEQAGGPEGISGF